MHNLADALSRELPAIFKNVIPEIQSLNRRRKTGAVIVGGAVRDLLLGKKVKEADLMLEHPAAPMAEALAKAFNAKQISYETFLTFTLHFPSGDKLDIVTAREETYSRPAALPVVKPCPIPQDFKRRDFTINTMACWLDKERYGELLDPVSGLSDLEKKQIRVLHNKSFEDDPTRIYRAARFAARFGFAVEKNTLGLIEKALEGKFPTLLSPVRRRHEFEAVLKEDNPVPALELLEKWGALSMIHADWKSVDESVKEILRRPSILEERLAAWFHPFGAARAERILTDLAFEKTVKKQVLSRL